MSEFEPVIYRSYAEFFVRRLRPEARKFPADPQTMGAFAEARYFAWEQLESEQSFPVKGHSLSAEHILVKAERARSFVGGPIWFWRAWHRSTTTTCIIPTMAGPWRRIGPAGGAGP